MNTFLNKFTKHTQTLPLHRTINPHKHWIIMLRIFFGIAILLIIFSLYLLDSITNEQVFQAVPASSKSASLLKEKLLNDTLTSLKAKDNKEADLLAHPLVYPDPSL